MDHLEALFAHVTPTARTFFAGNLCMRADFSGSGHLHVLQAGRMVLVCKGKPDVPLDRPTLLLFPRATPHRFVVEGPPGADLTCARVDLGGTPGSPLSEGLPDLIAMPLAEHPVLRPACHLLLGEAFTNDAGRQAALDRLFDYLLILIVRHLLARGDVAGGVLAGLADPRLARALGAMHEKPGTAWSLESLAEMAGMSRTRFADRFRTVVGRTPMDYLTGWRVTVAGQLLRKGRPLKNVAAAVGYDSAAAFSRVFARTAGSSPRQWTEHQNEQPGSIA